MEVESGNCRLCLTSSDNLINVFQDGSSNQTIAAILTQHFWFEIKENDSNKYICNSCWTKVESFHTFYIHVYNNYYECLAKVKVEIVDDNPINQNESDFEQIQESQIDKQSDKSFSDDDNILETTIENATKINGNAKQNMKMKQAKMKRTKMKHKKEDQDVVERENQQIRGYFKMECEICAMEFDKFQNIQTHYRKEHSLQGYLRCCNRKYTNRSVLVEHIQRHINPNAFKCELCNKAYKEKRGLEGHMERHKPPDERRYKCNDCSKCFTKKYSLVRHAYIHKTEETNFICNECGKSFGTTALLQIHTKNIHEGGSIYICDICGKVFRSKSVFEHHHQSVHEKKKLPKIQCQICSVWVRDNYYLKQHMDRHEESKVFCNICEKEYLNRLSLRKHIRSMHTNKVYECSMCEKTFKQSISLKEHMATHTGAALYTCPYCPKTFNSTGNMSSHKKKYHAKELKEHEKLKKTGAI